MSNPDPLADPTPAPVPSPPRHRLAALAIVALLLAILPAAAHAADLSDIDTAQRLLRQGDYGEALPLTEEMLDSLVPRITAANEDAAYLMATLHTLHALALAGAGDERGAVWHWRFAQSVSERLAKTSLAAYGEAGELLEGHRIRGGEGKERCSPVAGASGAGEGDAAGGEPAEDGAAEPVRVEGEVQAPVKVHAPPPSYPLALRKAGHQGPVVLHLIIDTEGTVHEVCVLRSPAPGLAHHAAKAVERWRFEPATLAGDPVNVYYNLTVNFKMR